MNIGEQVKKFRKSLGLNQGAFAARLNLSQSFICNIEKNRVQFTLEHIISIANIFNLNVNWLLTGTGEMKRALATEAEENDASLDSCRKPDRMTEEINGILAEMNEEQRSDVLTYCRKTKYYDRMMRRKTLQAQSSIRRIKKLGQRKVGEPA